MSVKQDEAWVRRRIMKKFLCGRSGTDQIRCHLSPSRESALRLMQHRPRNLLQRRRERLRHHFLAAVPKRERP